MIRLLLNRFPTSTSISTLPRQLKSSSNMPYFIQFHHRFFAPFQPKGPRGRSLRDPTQGDQSKPYDNSKRTLRQKSSQRLKTDQETNNQNHQHNFELPFESQFQSGKQEQPSTPVDWPRTSKYAKRKPSPNEKSFSQQPIDSPSQNHQAFDRKEHHTSRMNEPPSFKTNKWPRPRRGPHTQNFFQSFEKPFRSKQSNDMQEENPVSFEKPQSSKFSRRSSKDWQPFEKQSQSYQANEKKQQRSAQSDDNLFDKFPKRPRSNRSQSFEKTFASNPQIDMQEEKPSATFEKSRSSSLPKRSKQDRQPLEKSQQKNQAPEKREQESVQTDHNQQTKFTKHPRSNQSQPLDNTSQSNLPSEKKDQSSALPQSSKSPFHQALLAFALNNKKHLILMDNDNPTSDQSVAYDKEAFSKMLQKLKRWKQNQLQNCINTSLITLTNSYRETQPASQTPNPSPQLGQHQAPLNSQNASSLQHLPSTKRLCKQYFQILTENCENMSTQDTISVLYFINKLQSSKLHQDEGELGQGPLLRTVSKRLCDLFIEKANPSNPNQQEETIQLMKSILHSPNKQLHQQFMTLVLADRPPEANMSWHEQAKIKQRPKGEKLEKHQKSDVKLYESLSSEFHVQLLLNWQKTQMIDFGWRWQLSQDERIIKDLTQLLVDRFVSSPSLVDYLTSLKQLSKSYRIKVVPLLTKYRGTPQCRQLYTDVLTRLQQSLEEQLTNYQDVKENLASLTKLLYWIHRSDKEPLERKKQIVQGDLQIEEVPYQCTVLPSLDKLYQQLLIKPKKQIKGELPELLRYYDITQYDSKSEKAERPPLHHMHNGFMMMSWLIANTFPVIDGSLHTKLCQAHVHLLKENPSGDLFESTITRYLLKGQTKEGLQYLVQVCQSKLFDKKTSVNDTLERIELGNIVVDNVPDLDAAKLPHGIEPTFIDQLMAALYHGQMVPHTSLFFYRCTHLEKVLELMSLSPKYSKDRDFWLKSEDMILRQREQFDVHKLCRLATIYSRVNPSQFFWVELESILLGKASDFQPNIETAKSLCMVIVALAKYGRKNETFQKVFSNVLIRIKHELTEEQLITFCSILEQNNGLQLYKELETRFLTPNYLLPDNLEMVAKLALALDKHNHLHEVGGHPLFVMALKFLIVKATDLSQTTKGQDEILRELNSMTEVTKTQHQLTQVTLLKQLVRKAAQKHFEEQTDPKFKILVQKMLNDQLSDQLRSIHSDNKQQEIEKGEKRLSSEGKIKPREDSPFRHHPKFREDKPRIKGKRN